MAKSPDSYGERRARESERKQRAVLRSASHCFAQRGYRKTTVAAIAAHANVSKGLVFHFFKDKQALFAAVVEDSLQQWSLLSDFRAAESNDSALDELQRLFLASFEFVTQNPILSLFSHSDENMLSDYRSDFQKMNARWRRRIEKTLRRGIVGLEVDEQIDIRRVATIFHELQVALIRGASIVNQEPNFDEKTVNLAIELLLKGIARPNSPA